MNLENSQTTPDVASGHASESSPDASSGHGIDGQQVVDNGSGQPNAVSPQVDIAPKFEELRNSFNQKITEMGQTNAQLKQKLEEFELQQQQRSQALAQALGLAQEQETQPDILSQLVDDPSFLEKKIQEIAQQQVNPLLQEREMEKLEAYAAQQELERNEVTQELMQYVDEQTAKKIVENINVAHLVPPEIIQLNQRLQNDPMMSPEEKAQAAQRIQSETWKALQKAGGYRKLAHAALGETLMSDFGGFMQSAAKTFQSKQMQQQRAGALGSMSGGASQSTSGGTAFRSETIFR